MALLEGESKKDLKTDESMPYLATITHGITVDDHVVRKLANKFFKNDLKINVILFLIIPKQFRSMSFLSNNKI